MGLRIQHRGPDQHGEWQSESCSLIHKRLSIIDLSAAGRQPMATPDQRFVIAYNGEVYNYRELRERYAQDGWKFRTQTDTECFLASASLHGLSDLDQFHGMFAFALWDARERTLFLARDRMGIKPLFVTTEPINGRIGFASELPAVLEMRDDFWKLDRAARSTYLAVGYVPGPRTIVHGIESLPPGQLHHVRYDGWRSSEAYVDPLTSWPQPKHREEPAEKKLQEVVDQAVARQLVSDRPVGVFLSGGLDSTVVLSSMRRARPSAEINTFTTRFRHVTDDPKFNYDADVAAKIAEKYSTAHHEAEVTAEHMARAAEAMAQSLGQPHNNHSSVALNAAASLAAGSVPVVLSGDGGDESFGGYERYRLYVRAARLLRSRPTRMLVKTLARVHPRYPAWQDLLQATTEEQRLLFFHAAPAELRQRLFGTAAQDEFVLADWRARLDRMHGGTAVDRFMALDRETWLRDDAFVRADRLTMRHGVELRVPLTDDAVVEFALATCGMHVNGRATKRLWRKAFRDRCLPEMLSGPKRGWFPPTAKWMRHELHDWTREILSEAIATQAWIHGPTVWRLWEDHQRKRGYYLNELWTIVGYQLWWRAFRERLTE